MRIGPLLAFSAALLFSLSACSQSETRKLTNDAKATGEAVKQTASDALDASKKAVDAAGDQAKRAADSDTAKDIKEKTKRGVKRVEEKTKEASQELNDSLNKPAPPAKQP
jgi:gas vesicle protein